MSDLGNKEIFAKNLWHQMERYNIDRNKLCDALNIKYTTVSDWLNAKKYPRIDTIEMLADFFNIQKSNLIENQNQLTPEQKYKSNLFCNKIPILGKIPAGVSIEAIEDIIDYEEVSDDMLKGEKEYFGLKIKGNSMYPKYSENDIVLFLKVNDCESGDDCAVIINGNDAIFKKIIKHDTGIILQSINPEYESKFYSCEDIEKLPIRIIGIAKEIRRKI